jgi:hypothetical protein
MDQGRIIIYIKNVVTEGTNNVMLIKIHVYRLVAKLNHTHTISDLRQYIEA